MPERLVLRSESSRRYRWGPAQTDTTHLGVLRVRRKLLLLVLQELCDGAVKTLKHTQQNPCGHSGRWF